MSKCLQTSIKGFPLQLNITGNGLTRPTVANYTAIAENLSAYIDFQWSPHTTGLPITNPTGGTTSIQLEDSTSSSTVIYNGFTYTMYSVQIISATHGNWLTTDPNGKNDYDLAIILQQPSTTSGGTPYMVFILPLLTGDTDTGKDPAYLKAIAQTTVATAYTLQSCFVPQTTFASYIACFDGTGAGKTQSLQVFAATTGLTVSTSILSRFTSGTNKPQDIRFPTALGTSSSGTISAIDNNSANLQQYVTASVFSSGLTTSLRSVRTDPSSAYKCVELDPDSLDMSGNLQIDVNSGELTSTLKDILAERQVIAQMVKPQESGPASPAAASLATKIYEFFLTVIIILAVVFALYKFIFIGDTGYRQLGEVIGSVVIALLFIAGVGVNFFGKDVQMQTIGGWVMIAASIAAILFYGVFYVIWPVPDPSSCSPNPLSAAGLAAAAAAPAVSGAATTIVGRMKVSASGTWSPTQAGILGAILLATGFIIGNLI